jgi:hypothetical protein
LGAQALVGLIVAIGIVWFFFGGGLEKQTAKDMKAIEAQVAADAVQQYYIAAQQGDPIQVCVQAGFVVAAYLQAKDVGNYEQWKRNEERDCRQAGVR